MSVLDYLKGILGEEKGLDIGVLEEEKKIVERIIRILMSGLKRRYPMLDIFFRKEKYAAYYVYISSETRNIARVEINLHKDAFWVILWKAGKREEPLFQYSAKNYADADIDYIVSGVIQGISSLVKFESRKSA